MHPSCFQVRTRTDAMAKTVITCQWNWEDFYGNWYLWDNVADNDMIRFPGVLEDKENVWHLCELNIQSVILNSMFKEVPYFQTTTIFWQIKTCVFWFPKMFNDHIIDTH
jgi:hypothetical protein